MEREKQKTIDRDDDSSGFSNVIDQQYRINKQLLCAVGLWPYQSRRGKSAQIVGLLFVSYVVMVVQVDLIAISIVLTFLILCRSQRSKLNWYRLEGWIDARPAED